MSNLLAWHVNAWSDAARTSVRNAPTPWLLVLDTAIDDRALAEWHERMPDGDLAFRNVFGEQDPSDFGGRFEVLLRNAERVRRYAPRVTVLLPRNEECQTGDGLRAYNADSVNATRHLHGLGYKVACGNFSVCWPKVEDVHLYADACAEADYLSLHEYNWPSVIDDGERIGHYRAVRAALPEAARKPILLTEFGLDEGVIHPGVRNGWLAVPGLSAEGYAAQIRDVVRAMLRYVIAVFPYCAGGVYGWQQFEVAGQPAIESLYREVWPVYEFVLGFADLAAAMRARGLDPGEPTENESPHVFTDGMVVTRQRTTTGEMLWIKAVNQPLFASNAGRITLYNGGALLTTVPGV